MTQFEQTIKKTVKCDICGEIMQPLWGGGWDNDRLLCAARDCGAEIVFPTSTEHQCGGPAEACCVPGCPECGMPNAPHQARAVASRPE